MTRREHLWTILGEECAETSQRVSKLLRFGAGEVQPGQPLNNWTRALQEFNHVIAAAEMVFGGPVEDLINSGWIQEKKEAVEQYLKYSEDKGLLTP